ncbi:MAG: DUF433 domain-containing protein [Chloroflexi bacterium]|nr:DUF433 domain-containing protein [Chloroflexota bacterium]
MNRVAYGNEIIVIESRGKPKAALVGVDSITGTQGDGLIITTPGVRSGKPRIAGRRITVSDVVIWHEQMGIAPGQLAADYDLTLAQVYAALSYYHAHRDEISSEIEAGLSFAESLQNLSASPLDRKQQAERG